MAQAGTARQSPRALAGEKKKRKKTLPEPWNDVDGPSVGKRGGDGKKPASPGGDADTKKGKGELFLTPPRKGEEKLNGVRFLHYSEGKKRETLP